jgi:hypothetical protein
MSATPVSGNEFGLQLGCRPPAFVASDPLHLRRLLRPRRKRPRCSRATDKTNEFPPPHAWLPRRRYLIGSNDQPIGADRRRDDVMRYAGGDRPETAPLRKMIGRVMAFQTK